MIEGTDFTAGSSARKTTSEECIALVGSPNSGKTTLFNWLTGRRQKVVNYPGSTVDISFGPVLDVYGSPFRVVDTPGSYSLFPKSQDEEVTRRALYDPLYSIRKVIVVIDSTQISRQVHLVRQLQEAGFAVVIAVTMHDLYLKEKCEIDIAKMAKRLGAPVCQIDGTLGKGVKELADVVCNLIVPANQKKVELQSWSIDRLTAVFKDGEALQKEVAQKELQVFSKTAILDRYFLHPIFGATFFVAIMVGLFSSIYWAAAPLMDMIDAAFAWTIDIVKIQLGESLFSDLISDGILVGFGSVFIFVPQIFILFFGLSILEDSGYLARAATLIDKPLSKLGLNGKAFVPLLSGFACAVPAMMAARAINSQKERWIAMFIIPFMTCSARLPVYALLIAFLFGDSPFKAGLLMAGMYFGAVVVGAVAAGILNRLIKVNRPSFFILELPIYRRPLLKVVLRNSWKRTRAYLVKTGPIILGLSLVLWVLSTFPNYSEPDGNVRMQTSYAAQVGQVLEPIFEPMGADWRVGVGLISAFAAREVFVSSLAVMFNIADEDEDSIRDGLLLQMREATFSDGSKIFTPAAVAALLIFFMLALQCISTTATAKQEMNSTRFAVIQLVAMNVLAYFAAVLAYSVMS